ncbi:MAG: RNase adapter RapZ [Candidatus Nanopelagicales bacterium]|nr:RNase adapter RapZ [Candidatus Nanopelagicales bacterium]
MRKEPLDLVLVSGMSGAGRSSAARSLEDCGWFVIDNLPPAVLLAALEEVRKTGSVRRVAVVIDVRGGPMFTGLVEIVWRLRRENVSVRVLFLEATDEVLVRRFESSRRPHPLQGVGRIVDGLARERSALADLRGEADLVIDTSSLNIHELRRKIEAAFDDQDDVALRATVMSFGFKYGLPVDADLVADVRFLPNPFWEPDLRDRTGLDPEVSDYVTQMPEAREFLDVYAKMLDIVAGGYLHEGKRYVTIAVGCTGGKHRSVAMSEHLATRLVKAGVETLVVHRDLGRE